MSIRIKGLNNFIKGVQKQSSSLDKAVSQELKRASLRVEKRAKMYAPWDTGWLSNSIYSVMVSQLWFEVISPVEYSIWVEEGTRYMAAIPFMRPAMKDEEPIIMRNLRRIVGGK